RRAPPYERATDRERRHRDHLAQAGSCGRRVPQRVPPAQRLRSGCRVAGAMGTRARALCPASPSATRLHAGPVPRRPRGLTGASPYSPRVDRPSGLLLSVLIPVYNEERTIAEVIDRVDAVDLRKEIIVVDVCSSDRTSKILRQ